MTASRPDRTGSKGVSQMSPGRRGGTAGLTGGRVEIEFSVARPLATLQLWSRIITSGLTLDWHPEPTALWEDEESVLDFDAASGPKHRPLEPGIPYPWPWPQIKHELTETVLHIEQLR